MIVSGLSNRQYVTDDGFVIHDEISRFIRSSRANQSDMNRKRMIQQPCLSSKRHMFDQFLGRSRVESTATVRRVNECAKSNMSDASRTSGSNVAIKMTDDALGKVVRFDFARQCQSSELRTQSPVSTDDAPQ